MSTVRQSLDYWTQNASATTSVAYHKPNLLGMCCCVRGFVYAQTPLFEFVGDFLRFF